MKSTQIRMEWLGGDISKKIQDANRKAIGEIAEDLARESSKEVPLDVGTLQLSLDIDIEDNSKGADATVFYDTPYAARLHEHPEYNFQGGRKGKYLEDPLKANETKYKLWLLKAYNAVFKWRT